MSKLTLRPLLIFCSLFLFGIGWQTSSVTAVTDTLSDLSIYTANTPSIAVSPPTLQSTQAPDAQIIKTFTIENNGSTDLTWTIDDDNVVQAEPQTTSPAIEWVDTPLSTAGDVGKNPLMQAFLDDRHPPQKLAAASTTQCVNGMAGIYPCKNINLQAFMPLADIGGGEGSDIWGWTGCTNREFAIMGRTNGTAFVEITDPANPVYLGNLPTHTVNSNWRDIKTYADHAFIVSEASSHGMQIFDLTQLCNVASSPATFSNTAHYNGFGNAHNIVINEDSGYAYAVGTATCGEGLHMVDISTPTSPSSTGCFSADGYTHDAQCVMYNGPDTAHVGKEICLNSNEDTLTIVDVSNKGTPIQLSRTGYLGHGYTHQGWLTEDHTYFLLNDELDEQNLGHNTRTRIWDVSDLDSPSMIGFYDGPTTAVDHNLYVKDSLVYESNYRAGLRVLDISDIANANLSEVAYFDIYPTDDNPSTNGNWSNYPYFPSGNLAISGIEQGLFVLKLQCGTPWASASPASGTTTANGNTAVNVTFDSAGLSNGTYNGTLCINTNDPNNPIINYPVSLTVSTNPVIDVDPTSLSSTQVTNTSAVQTLTVSNIGGSDLTWTIDEDNTQLLKTAAQQSIKLADFSEGFDDISNLPSWATDNNPDATGSSAWFQGNSNVFSAQSGAATSYIGANFNNTGGSQISNWLMTPEVDFTGNSEISFWTRTGTGSIYPDRLQMRVSTNGSSTDVGATPTSVGDFTNLLLDINENLTTGGYPESWQQYTVDLSAYAGQSGRIAFRYYVPTSAGPTGSNSNYIGIDTVEFVEGSVPPCTAPTDIPWLSLTPSSGTTSPSGSTDVDVTFDSTGLANGTYTASLCVDSNDPVTPQVIVPVTLVVDTPTPDVAVNPTSLSSTQPTDSTRVQSFDIENNGTADLTWTLSEEPNAQMSLLDEDEGKTAVSLNTRSAIDKLRSATNQTVELSIDSTTGVVDFARFASGKQPKLAGLAPKEKALNFLTKYGAAFGLPDVATQLALQTQTTDNHGFTHLTYEQQHEGVSVFGGTFRVHFDKSGNITAVNGTIVPNIVHSSHPALKVPEIEEIALAAVIAQPYSHTHDHHDDDDDDHRENRGEHVIAREELSIHQTTPYLYRTGLVEGVAGDNHLVYEVEVRAGGYLREFLYIDAHTGQVLERYTAVETTLFRRLYETNTSNEIWTEGDAFPGSLDQWQQNELVAAGHTYNLFENAFGWTSYDNNGAEMRTINNDPNISCPNANWNGVTANYCTGTATDDVVAHEWGHAYTEYTNNLIYAWQAGALNEAYSDIWGETVDLLNNYEDAGEDLSLRTGCNSSDRWRMGEDATAFGGAIRDMWDPTCDGDPGKVSDSQYVCSAEDSGGVHSNSGVPNHAFALLVDGGTYNGQTISAIGFTKAAHIHWRAQSVYETNVSNFEAHADALEQSCIDLIGVNLEGLSTGAPVGPSGEIITAADCQEVAEVVLAVEFREEACAGTFTPLLDPSAPALCSVGEIQNNILAQDFETGLGSWTVGQEPVNPATWDSRDWTLNSSLPDGRAGTAVYGVNPVVGNCSSDLDNGVIYLESPAINIPADVDAPIRMAFDHYVSLESLWDGGNLKYSTDGTNWTPVPSNAFTFNEYNATLNNSDNPLGNEAAFTGADGGAVTGSWGQSQLDLSVIGIDPGDTVYLRWELGTDGCNGWDGWYVDDVEVYSCSLACSDPNDVSWLSVNPTSGTTTPGTTTSVAVTFDATGLSDGDYEAHICLNSNDPETPLVAVPANMTVLTADPPTITMHPDGSFTRSNENPTCSYSLLRSATPYEGHEWVSNDPVSYDGSASLTDVNLNYFYLLEVACEGGSSATSANESGEFTFEVEPGSP